MNSSRRVVLFLFVVALMGCNTLSNCDVPPVRIPVEDGDFNGQIIQQESSIFPFFGATDLRISIDRAENLVTFEYTLPSGEQISETWTVLSANFGIQEG